MTDKDQKGETEISRRIRDRRNEKKLREAPAPVKLQTLYSQRQETEAELEKKRLRSQNLSMRLFSGILTMIIGLLLAGYVYLPQFRFNDIRITGMDRINKNEIIYFTGAKGKPVFAVNPSEVRRTLLQHYQEFYDVDVTIGFPAEMEIMLTERVPVVEWDFGGSRFWIDQDGKVLNESNSQEKTIHVYADSYPGALYQEDRDIPFYFSRDVLKTIVTMGNLVPEGKPLIYTYRNGFGWDTDDGWRIFFGKTDDDIEEKLR
ncbi:MAG: FtsQ-type POTRA domain-containing protein, partial [Anaerolineaceae bacterium]|nr:FtsQ-type POTRA domain-containing protein [Anaerolineaceae bacterium]